MPVCNVYKSAPTKKLHVQQNYYVSGLSVTIYKDGHVLLAYRHETYKSMKKVFKSNSKEAEYFIKMVRAKNSQT